jgi:hypothetical protein
MEKNKEGNSKNSQFGRSASTVNCLILFLTINLSLSPPLSPSPSLFRSLSLFLSLFCSLFRSLCLSLFHKLFHNAIFFLGATSSVQTRFKLQLGHTKKTEKPTSLPQTKLLWPQLPDPSPCSHPLPTCKRVYDGQSCSKSKW